MSDFGSAILMIMYGRSVGGAELQFIELANALAERHKVRLIALGGDGAFAATQLDARVSLKVFPYRNWSSARVNELAAIVWAMLDNSPFVITTSFGGNFVGFAATRFRKRRLISLQTVSKSMHSAAIDRYILRRFDALVAGAGDIRDYLLAHGQYENRIHVIHNWVDFSKRKPSVGSSGEVKERYRIGDQTVLGCIGRFHQQKGQVYLVRAYAEIVKVFPNTVLLLVGDGSTRAELEGEVQSLGLGGSVVFTGTVTGEDYNNLLSIIDIYVQPSIFEGLPRTLLDAMYMGKAIVASDINGNREALEDGVNGLLVPARDAVALTTALLRLLHDPGEREALALAARSQALRRFGMEQKLAEIERLVLNIKQ